MTKAKAKAPDPIVWHENGAITFNFPDGPVTWEAPMVGQMEQIFEIEDSIIKDDDTPPWKDTARFICEVSGKVYGHELEVSRLPQWALSFAVRRAIIGHFLSVPFDLPVFGRAATETVPTPQTGEAQLVEAD